MYQAFIKPLYQDIKTFVLDTLFPISCLSCGEEGNFICVDCKVTMKSLEHQRCISCHKQAPFGITHSKCLTTYTADQLISCYDYHDKKIAKIIIAGKYKFIKDVFQDLGTIIAAKLKQGHPYLLTPNTYFLIPIPLHSSRHRWRGFNQAEILCQTISEQLQLPCASVLVRCKITKTQKDLKKEQRLNNTMGAFAIDTKADIKGKSFILVDDVTTTGSTLQEAVKVLKRNGALKVACLTVARD